MRLATGLKIMTWLVLFGLTSWSTSLFTIGISQPDDGLMALGLMGLGLAGWWLSYGCWSELITPLNRRSLIWGLGLLASLVGFSLVWVSLSVWLAGGRPTGNQAQLNQLLTQTGWRQWLMWGQVVIIAPVLEEALYRGLWQAWFLTAHPKWQLLLSSGCFAWVHAGFNVGAGLLYLGAGLILGYGFKRTQDLKITIGVHSLYNLLGLII